VSVEKIVINFTGVTALLRDPSVLALLKSHAEKIAASAGPGNKVETETGKQRARAAVITESYEAMKAEAQHSALSNAAGSG
jgi:hypothetical protein